MSRYLLATSVSPDILVFQDPEFPVTRVLALAATPVIRACPGPILRPVIPVPLVIPVIQVTPELLVRPDYPVSADFQGPVNQDTLVLPVLPGPAVIPVQAEQEVKAVIPVLVASQARVFRVIPVLERPDTAVIQVPVGLPAQVARAAIRVLLDFPAIPGSPGQADILVHPVSRVIVGHQDIPEDQAIAVLPV